MCYSNIVSIFSYYYLINSYKESAIYGIHDYFDRKHLNAKKFASKISLLKYSVPF